MFGCVLVVAGVCARAFPNLPVTSSALVAQKRPSALLKKLRITSFEGVGVRDVRTCVCVCAFSNLPLHVLREGAPEARADFLEAV